MTDDTGPSHEPDPAPSWDCYERVPCDSWAEIVAHYRSNYGDGRWGDVYRPMVGLVEAIASSAYASALFGRCTPKYPINDHQGQLNLSRTRTLIKHHEILPVTFVPAEVWLLFEYYQAAHEPKPWATVCAPAEGFAKLEWLLTKRMRWFKMPQAGRQSG